MHISKKFTFAVPVFALICSSCAELTHLTRSRTDFDSRRVTTMVDAKQRAITAVKTTDGRLVSCAEPSPDTLSALAASNGINLSSDEIRTALNSAYAESASSIGLRTQSIQLMRDGMYRLCEGSQNGYINEMMFEALSRRYQTYMVAILAIEQLTGAVTPGNVVLTGNASSGSAELASKYTDLKIAQRAKVDSAESAFDKAQAAVAAAEKERREKADALLTAAKITDGDESKLSESDKANLKQMDDGIKAKKKTQKDAKETLDDQNAILAAYEEARIAALAGGGTASSSAKFTPAQYDQAKAVKDIAPHVEKIVTMAFDQGALVDLCPSFLGKLATGAISAYYADKDGNRKDNPLIELCSGVVTKEVQSLTSP